MALFQECKQDIKVVNCHIHIKNHTGCIWPCAHNTVLLLLLLYYYYYILNTDHEISWITYQQY